MQTYFGGLIVKKLSLILVLSALAQYCAINATDTEFDKANFMLKSIRKKEATIYRNVRSESLCLYMTCRAKARAALWASHEAGRVTRTRQYYKEAEQEWLVHCQQVGVQRAVDSSRYNIMRQKELVSK